MTIKIGDLIGLTPEEMAQKFTHEQLGEFLNATASQPTAQQAAPDDRGITPRDPNQDFFSAENASTMASNFVPSLSNMAGDFADLVSSPIESGKAIMEAGPSGIWEGLKERYGGIENLKRTLTEDPGGSILDVTPGLGALGKVSKAASTASKFLNPIKATTRVVEGAGKGGAVIARSAAAAASGSDPGLLSTGREVMGATAKSKAPDFEGIGISPKDALKQSGEFVDAQRAAFIEGTRGAGAVSIQEGVKKVTEGISKELDEIAQRGEAAFGHVPVDLGSYQTAFQGIMGKLDKRGIRLRGGKLNFDKSVIDTDTAAHGRITQALTTAFNPIQKGNATIGDVWMVRKRIDEAHSNALKQLYGDTESSVLQEIRHDVSDFLKSIDNEDFQTFNGQYAGASAMREHFGMLIANKIDPDNQVAALVKNIKSGRELSGAFLTQVEAKTGVPLRAIAAGRELNDILPKGLVGRTIFAGFATMTFGADALIGLFLAPPKLLGLYLRGIGATERTIRMAGEFVERVMSLPKARALAEEGMTMGLILKQLEREQPEAPSLMGRLGGAE